MCTVTQLSRMATFIIFLVFGASSAAQQVAPSGAVTRSPQGTADLPRQATADPPRFLKAFVIDDRLSALRRDPRIQSEVIRRIRLAQPVFIIGTSKGKTGEPKFYRVAVTRRTRGWIHASAIAALNRTGEDQRIMSLIEHSSDGVDKITLCRLIISHFRQSRLVPRAMLLLGEEAERAAKTVSQRTRRRLSDVRTAETNLRDYFLSDAGLDRYSRLGIAFDFNESSGDFSYDGKAYREIIRRFPNRDEAKLARQHLDLANRKTAQAR